MNPLSLQSTSSDETRRIAEGFARALPAGSIVALHGELGAGKTCFVQGMALALGITELVNSPTFTLINEYAVETPLIHVDLYRVGSEREALELGLEDYFRGSGIVAVEWPERIPGVLRAWPHWRVEIGAGHTPDERRIVMEGPA